MCVCVGVGRWVGACVGVKETLSCSTFHDYVCCHNAHHHLSVYRTPVLREELFPSAFASVHTVCCCAAEWRSVCRSRSL